MKRFAATAVAAVLILIAPAASRAQGLREQIEPVLKGDLATQGKEFGAVVRGYLIKHTEAIGGAWEEMPKPETPENPDANAKTAADRRVAIASHAALLFASTHQVTLGNPEGDVTLVEFFDYNCGFCRRALADMLALLKDDAKLKVVLKEFPILGPASSEAAGVAVAVRMQDPGGQRYLAFHRELLGSLGPVRKNTALAAARDQGLDMGLLERDMASDEIRATIAEDLKLAAGLGIAGTPGYVVGNDVVLGAVGITALKARIAAARGIRPN
jgi:protein-disulfide isomerase